MLKVATYNIHGCIGLDGRHDPSRIADVLYEIGADILALQEVDTGLSHNSSVNQLEYLKRVLGYHAIEGLIMKKKTGVFGNVLLTSHKILAARQRDLTILGGRQRRGAIDADIDISGHPLRVVATHLGLAFHERYFQIRRLLHLLGTDRKSPVLIMGDFNLFTSGLPRFRRLQRRLGAVPKIKTFPAGYPLLPLDRIWSQPKTALISISAHQTPLSRIASDHLPLVGHLHY